MSTSLCYNLCMQVLIWDYNIPVPIKYISEPSMHSIPSTTLHPTGKCWVGQSLDNQVSHVHMSVYICILYDIYV